MCAEDFSNLKLCIEWKIMGPFLINSSRFCVFLVLFGLSVLCGFAQSSTVLGPCNVSAVPLQTRSEGITERVGDIVVQCSGAAPGAVLSGNLSVSLPVSITNR